MLEDVLAPENPNGTVAASHWIFCTRFCPERKHCKECKDLIGWFDSCEKYRCYADAARANAGDPGKEPKSLREFMKDILKHTSIKMKYHYTGDPVCKYLIELVPIEPGAQPVYKQYTNGGLGLETALECLAVDLGQDIHEAVQVERAYKHRDIQPETYSYSWGTGQPMSANISIDCTGWTEYALDYIVMPMEDRQVINSDGNV